MISINRWTHVNPRQNTLHATPEPPSSRASRNVGVPISRAGRSLLLRAMRVVPRPRRRIVLLRYVLVVVARRRCRRGSGRSGRWAGDDARLAVIWTWAGTRPGGHRACLAVDVGIELVWDARPLRVLVWDVCVEDDCSQSTAVVRQSSR